MEKGNEVPTGGPAVRAQADTAKDWDRLFTHPDGSRLTPAELRAEAADEELIAQATESNIKGAVAAGDQDAEYQADLQGRADRGRERAAAMRQEADRLEHANSPSSGQPADQTQERELPSGSITHPDGTTTELERLPDGTRRETKLDAEGNVISSTVIERLPGDWARSEHTDES